MGATEQFSGGHEQRPLLGSFAMILHYTQVSRYIKHLPVKLIRAQLWKFKNNWHRVTSSGHTADSSNHLAKSWHCTSHTWRWGRGETALRRATLVLVHSTAEYCAPTWCCIVHTCLIDPVINAILQTGWKPVSYTRHLIIVGI